LGEAWHDTWHGMACEVFSWRGASAALATQVPRWCPSCKLALRVTPSHILALHSCHLLPPAAT
jgi:hypothetical protein